MNSPLKVVLIGLALMVAIPGSVAGQNTDAQYLSTFRSYWRQLDTELSLAQENCADVTSRIQAWTDRNGEAVDSLLARSAGLPDRLTEGQMNALLSVQEPLLMKVASVGARCRRTPGFRELMDRVNAVLAMGG